MVTPLSPSLALPRRQTSGSLSLQDKGGPSLTSGLQSSNSISRRKQRTGVLERAERWGTRCRRAGKSAQAAQVRQDLKVPRGNGPAPRRRAPLWPRPSCLTLGRTAYLSPAAAARTQTLTRAAQNPAQLPGGGRRTLRRPPADWPTGRARPAYLGAGPRPPGGAPVRVRRGGRARCGRGSAASMRRAEPGTSHAGGPSPSVPAGTWESRARALVSASAHVTRKSGAISSPAAAAWEAAPRGAGAAPPAPSAGGRKASSFCPKFKIAPAPLGHPHPGPEGKGAGVSCELRG